MHISLTVAGVVGMLLAVACGQISSPTRPTSAPSAASSSMPSSGGMSVTALGGSALTSLATIPASFSIRPSGKAAIQACIGEAVTFTGNALFLAHQTILPDGSLLLDTIHFDAQGAVAVGATTGVTYRLAGADSNEIILVPAGTITGTFDANLLAIGPGGANSFLAHILQHITITPDGSITALLDIVSADCR